MSRRRALAGVVVLLLTLLAGCLVAEQADREVRVLDPTSASDDPQELSGTVDPESGLPWVAESELPAQASEVLDLIDAGGPFPYDQDGSTFGNFEGLLPQEPQRYYAEYTVDTPGLDHRGARRIVTGSEGQYYWTEDHYESFERIAR